MSKPKVRFAPSPTGHLHVGNMRTALVNYLFAKKYGGDFMLRIDDTDDVRSTKEFEDSIRTDLKWMGLNWDSEDRQSEHLDRYHGAVETLLESGRAYACFESTEELALKRKSQLAAGKPPVYDRTALNLSSDEIESRIAEGEQPHYRFLLNHERVTWQDLVRGAQSIAMSSLSDPVILRADGRFIYTLASVVDDGTHNITHILRGEDHTTNSAAQIQLFEALGYQVPEMGHFALLVGADGEGLSKRLGSLSIGAMRDEGIEAMTIASLLARLGTSDPIEPRSKMADLIAGFEVSRFGRATPRFDPEQLRGLNAKVLAEMDFADVGVDKNLWEAVRGNINTRKEAEEWAQILGADGKIQAEAVKFRKVALATLPEGEINAEFWGKWTKAIMEKTGLKGKAVFAPLREALTGRQKGPEMAKLLPLLGRERIMARLKGGD